MRSLGIEIMKSYKEASILATAELKERRAVLEAEGWDNLTRLEKCNSAWIDDELADRANEGLDL